MRPGLATVGRVARVSFDARRTARKQSNVGAKLKALAESDSRELRPILACELRAHGCVFAVDVTLVLDDWSSYGVTVIVAAEAQHGRDRCQLDGWAEYRRNWSVNAMLTGGVTTTAVLLMANLTELLREPTDPPCEGQS